MQIYAGTSGYSYKTWKGSFYPEKLPAKDMLRHYATQLPAVEINSTFYRLPRAETLATWAEQVPDTFRFAIKASRRITHMKRLKDADDETSYLLKTLDNLGPRLGVVLFQLPPNLKKDLDRLDAFLELLMADEPAVFEFRHESWLDDEVHERLRAKGCALCIADVDDAPEPELIETAPFGYLRLRREAYDDAAIATWAERVRGAGWNEAYVFFKHEDDAAGPAYARKFLGLP